MMCLKLKLNMVLAGESDVERHCYKEDVKQKTGSLTEKSSKESQSNISDLSISRSFDLNSTVKLNGEDTTVIKQ